MDKISAVLVAVALALIIAFTTCYNMMDKWRFRADRQYPYVRELLEEWERVTRRLLETSGVKAPDVPVAGQKHPWDAVAAANRLAEACPAPDFHNPVTAPILGRQGELEEELDTWLQVFNSTAASYNKVLDRIIVRDFAKLFKWQKWEELNFNPHGAAKTDPAAE